MSVTTRRYTYADLLNTPDDGNRYEILDGELIVSAAPVKRHQRMLYLLLLAFASHIEPRHLGHLYFAPVDVMFGTSNVVEPDLIFIRRDRLHIYQDRVVTGAPDIILEALSPTSRVRDLNVKFKLYETAGVPEYWVADPETPGLMLFVLNASGRYEQVHPVDGFLHSHMLPGFAINLLELFAALDTE
jgi:Uma2 family endonuclease